MIEIKKSHKGLLHKQLGVPEGKKISLSTLLSAKAKAKRTGNGTLAKRVNFAENARNWS